MHLLDLRDEQLEIIELEVADESPAAGRSVAEVALPDGCLIISVLRRGRGFVPKADTVIEAGDEVLLVLDPGLEQAVMPVFTAERRAVAADRPRSTGARLAGRRGGGAGGLATMPGALAGWCNRQHARFWPWYSRFESLPGSCATAEPARDGRGAPAGDARRVPRRCIGSPPSEWRSTPSWQRRCSSAAAIQLDALRLDSRASRRRRRPWALVEPLCRGVEGRRSRRAPR